MATPSVVASPHIVICGGGVIGACTAYFLSTKSSSPAARITIIERSCIACGASGKAGGFLALDWCSPPLSNLARASFLLHRSLSLSLSGPLSYGYRPLHTFSLPIHPQPDSSSHSLSLPSWIDSPTAGSPRTIGTPETTAQVHPHLFTQTLITASSADVLIGEVTRVEVIQGRATGVILKDGREIPADAVVLALGPWSSRSPIISSLFGISGIKAHSIVVRPREPDAITPHALFLSYQDSPGARMLDPEVYPRPTGNSLSLSLSLSL